MSEEDSGEETPMPQSSVHPIEQATLVPMSLSEANAFVTKHHRHHKPMVGHKYSIGLANGQLRGVIIVGRPISRHRDDGLTLEVTRCCTDGIRNGCSKLYRAAWRVAINLGFQRLITYTLPDEGGASLRGAGFRLVGKTKGGNWNVPSRPRSDTKLHLQGQKLLWEAPSSNEPPQAHTLPPKESS